ncbi:LD-carboxypeptidase [Cyanobacterium aponinum UTEX 3221]|uniref:S66 peptidase family protein n=1 Tax=Cyanobacterium aponinum TaxID=379064 RepID=UPI000C12DB5F|nr:LD-carboxypeptidase [Cyanobacterium aponinum]PHV62608.1 LD-carboxypeptidase [Cyanobacterium aponinum IPPAS B-1201]WRL39159.1 LD-carboxypeptidase [Cyanobacterium aponinum UTEX 3221]
MFVPPPLHKGDTLIAIAPSGTLREREKERFEEGLKIWQERGYKIVLEENYEAREGYLAGNDAIRRQALEVAWTNPEYKGIICVRGGYGGARLLENWQWAKINPPKWFIGFSDVTSLLWSLYNENIISLHGPVLTTIAQESQWSIERLFNYIEGEKLPELQGKGWGGKKATGRLLPANLTVATHLLCTPVCPKFNDVILALEDVQEAPYKIDRMITQWRLMGILDKVKGVILGRFSGCDAPESIPSWTVEQVWCDRLQGLEIPIISNLPFGHDGDNACLPVGGKVEIDGETGILSFL